jgi:cytochrome P450
MFAGSSLSILRRQMTGTEATMVDEALAAQVGGFRAGDPGLADPHPLFEQMRDKCPVAHSYELGGYWIMSRYDDIREALRDPSTYSSSVISVPEFEEDRGKMIPLNYDPPEHTAFRSEFASWFSPAVVKRTEPGSRERIIGYLESFVAKGGGDFISAVAEPFPCVTFLLALGLPIQDIEQLIEWKNHLLRTLLSDDPQKVQFVVGEVIPKINAYFAAQIEARTAAQHRPDDVLTLLVNAKAGEVPFTLEDKIQTLIMFMLAGLDTVTGTLGYFVKFLATHPDHRQQLIDDPSLIPNAVEELLRYFTIITLARKVIKTVDVDGVTIPEGDLCVFLLQSAGRDELQYENPEEVDFHRTPIRHMALGAGPHRCLGSHLARMELAVALEEVLRIVPHFEIDPSRDVINHWGWSAGVDYLPLVVR